MLARDHELGIAQRRFTGRWRASRDVLGQTTEGGGVAGGQ